MIFHLHRQALVRGIERRPLRHRPRLQHAVHLQAKVVMQTRGAVLLHHKTMPLAALDFAGGLRRLFEVAFAFVFFEGHNNV